MLLLVSVIAVLGAALAAPAEGPAKFEVAASAIVNGEGKSDAESYLKNGDLNKDGKLSEDEVIEVSGRFIPFKILELAMKATDKNKDGFLQKDEVAAFLDEAHKLLLAEAEKALKGDDTDKNGKISRKEAESASDLIEIEITHFDKHFKAADKNSDGELDKNELIHFVVSNKHDFIKNYHGELLAGADTNKDKNLDLKEFTAAVTGHYPKAVIKPAFDAADLNKDGKLDDAEHLISTQIGSTLIVQEFDKALPSIDGNKDKRLDLEELKKLAAKLDIEGVNGDFVAEYFELAHDDKQKTVDESEALSFLTNGHSGIPTFFKDFDKDKNKKLSETEALALAEKLKFDLPKFKTAFAEADKDKNGLTPEELRNALHSYTGKSKGEKPSQ